MNMQRDEIPKHSAKFLRQRKFLLILPVLVMPFLTFLLWTLGLVGEVKAQNTLNQTHQGFNMNLPSAAPAKDSAWNKMKYYEQADRDSMHLRTLLKNDPYRKLELDVLNVDTDSDSSLAALESKAKYKQRVSYDPYPVDKQQDYNEKRVHQKLAALQEQLDKTDKEEQKAKSVKQTSQRSSVEPAAINPDVAKLEAMMSSMQEGTGENAELKQLNSMLDKIMDIQHPQRMEDKIKAQSEKSKRQVFPVKGKPDDMISVLETGNDWSALLQHKLPDTTINQVQEIFERNRFYSLDDENIISSPVPTAIEAIIPEEQTVLNGATIQLRLLQELFVNGVLIPKQTSVSGTVSFTNNRLQIAIESIVFNRSVFPVNLTVYSKDGIPGLPLDASSLNDAAKQTMTGTMQSIDIGTLDQSLGAQAASAGIQAVKTLFNKKVKQVRMTVPAGYTVLLVDSNNKNK